MELRTKEGMRIISDKDYEIIHTIKHKWDEFHKYYFKGGRMVSDISKLFEEFGKVENNNK